MSLFNALNTAASGLSAERLRMDVTAENLANAQTTRGADGQPLPAQGRRAAGGRRDALRQDTRRRDERRRRRRGRADRAGRDAQPPRLRPRPSRRRRAGLYLAAQRPAGHRDGRPDSSSRAYEANVTVMQTAKQMFNKTLELLR
jgi:flagellar basal-body rod protein FlgC